MRFAAVFEPVVVSGKTVTAHRRRASSHVRCNVQPGFERSRRPHGSNVTRGAGAFGAISPRGVSSSRHSTSSERPNVPRTGAVGNSHSPRRTGIQPEGTSMNPRTRIPRRSRRAIAPGTDHIESRQLRSTVIEPHLARRAAARPPGRSPRAVTGIRIGRRRELAGAIPDV
jgi:hypothetical protein